jgi:hypothetical protein
MFWKEHWSIGSALGLDTTVPGRLWQRAKVAAGDSVVAVVDEVIPRSKTEESGYV